MKRNKKNILEQKEAELVSLNMQSVSAVQLVQNTIDGLDRTNSQIKEKIDEIELIQRQFSDIQSGLESTFNRNNKIMQNFKAMPCID